MATVKYLLQGRLENTTIYLRLSVSRDINIKAKTIFTISPTKWDKAKGLPKGRDVESINLSTTLKKLGAHVLSNSIEDNAKGLLINNDWLKDQINTFFNHKSKESLDFLTEYSKHFLELLPSKISDKGKRPTESTIKKYTTIHNKLIEFEKYKRKRILIKDVDLKLRSQLIEWFSDVDGLADNTIGRYLKFIKAFVLDARANGLEVNPQIESFKGFTVEAQKITLSFAELDELEQSHFDNQRLEMAKDWLIIGCYTGQRVSDLLRMNSHMVKEISGHQFICLTQQKTGKFVQIPLHHAVKRVLLKRGGKFPESFTNNIGSSSSMLNKLIKIVGKELGFNEVLKGTLYNSETKRSETGNFEKWRLMTSHICRRSFATNFYTVIPTPLLMNITAHSTEKMFLQYIGKPPIDYSIQLAEIWKVQGGDNLNPQLRVLKSNS